MIPETQEEKSAAPSDGSSAAKKGELTAASQGASTPSTSSPEYMEQRLSELGFPQDRVSYALAKTNYAGLQQATDWLIENAGKEIPADLPTPNCLKCQLCGNLFTSVDDANEHANKTGHQDFGTFAEPKARMSDEEKQTRLKELQAKLREKRVSESAERVQQERMTEIMRRKEGRELAEAKQTQDDREMKKIIDDRKKEKMADKRARDRILQQIEEDKKERAARLQPVSL